VVLGAVLLAAAGCSDSSSDVTPTLPTAPTLTETFTGSLTQNGSATFTFAVTAAGSLTATLANLTRVDGNTTLVPIAVGLGTWNGAVCNVTLSNDTSLPGSTIPAQAALSGNFCVRVSDATGQLAVAENYTVTVLHP
jgi:hypothetical protein